VILSQVMRAKVPVIATPSPSSFSLCAGVTPWGLFAGTPGRAKNFFPEHPPRPKKLSSPRLCLPVILILNAGVNFLIIFGLFTAFLVISGNFPGWVYFATIPLLIIQIAFAVGLGITLGVLNVFFRDIGQLFGVVLQFWFWLTPIVYPVTILPQSLRPLMDLNPMAGLVGAYQTILVTGQWPVWQNLWFVTLLSILMCGLAMRMFRKHAGEMVDEL